MTEGNKSNFQMAHKCHIHDKMHLLKDVKERDRNHVTSKYRGSAHQMYNFNFRLTDKLPVIFTNL